MSSSTGVHHRHSGTSTSVGRTSSSSNSSQRHSISNTTEHDEPSSSQIASSQHSHSSSTPSSSSSHRRKKRISSRRLSTSSFAAAWNRTTRRWWRSALHSEWLPLALVVVVMGLTFVVVYTGLTYMSHWLFNDSGNSGSGMYGRGSRNALPNRGIQGADYDPVRDLDKLPWNPLYRVPDSISVVGDRSDEYVTLRKEADDLLLAPETTSRRNLLAQVEDSKLLNLQARPMEAHNSDQVVPYDIYNCPDTPPVGYPYAWKTVDLLSNWPVDNTQPPLNDAGAGLIHQSLCVFDYQTEYNKAVAYRDASLPFVVVNDPAVQTTVARWAMPNYVNRLMGDVLHRTEYSENTHFMYYVPPPKNKRGLRNRGPGGGGGGAAGGPNNKLFANRGGHRFGVKAPEGWTAPTKMKRMTFEDWLQHANVTDDQTGPGKPHWYFRLIGCGTTANDGSCDAGSSEYLFDELPFFQPKPSLYIVEPGEQKGIHCRFGMKGVIAENHFDSSRNAIVVLAGSRRYILSHPDQCDNLVLYPKGHPSARHSAVNWADPDLDEFPAFAHARSSEVVLQAGQVLYLPTNWFHFIQSLELNYQCNSRSGIETPLMDYVRACGF